MNKALILAAGVALAATAATAQDTVTVDIDDITCRDLLHMGGTEREYTMVYAHGFLNGLNGKRKAEAAAMAALTDEVVDACIADPEGTVFGALEKAAK
ncbi:HdeA/HdeB family chaperone [Chachezhania antarctica]|uniref:HdeA/HdeB family chaperone n=1 Tax=Chachezhania antarctica TaxID=2340860 RepID=UPI000EAD3394|nr:HdeA/HdeB family chaperone [Chachezhania antarctica]|tara:strand:- start:2634 stop:2927 length:294 start_codon:yes stop_codon:yes gene_type:complete